MNQDLEDKINSALESAGHRTRHCQRPNGGNIDWNRAYSEDVPELMTELKRLEGLVSGQGVNPATGGVDMPKVQQRVQEWSHDPSIGQRTTEGQVPVQQAKRSVDEAAQRKTTGDGVKAGQDQGSVKHGTPANPPKAPAEPISTEGKRDAGEQSTEGKPK